MKQDKYSVTSNTIKLLKHLPTLQDIQNGKYVPIMVHMMPTHRCQLNCAHCCFKNRKNLILDMALDVCLETLEQFYLLGTRAVELTGGGEPTLYPYIDRLMSYLIKRGFHVGIITNAMNIERIEKYLDNINWVRVSLNPLDYNKNLDSAVKLLKKSKSSISFCYIWNQHSLKNIAKVDQFAKKHQIICRVAPDCIQPLDMIKTQMAMIRNHLAVLNTQYLFLSDFNTTLTRRGDSCYMHMLKPAFYTDGYIYPCPSAELAVENNKQVNTDFRLCFGTKVYDFYTNPDFKTKLKHACSYCKYSKQNDLIQDLLTETDFNEFA